MTKKQISISFILLLTFLLLLFHPALAFKGSCNGLTLWFETVLPTLFPYLILSDILLSTGAAYTIASVIHPVCTSIFHTTKGGSFVVLIGFLCGFPLGAKMVADLTSSQCISKKEGQYLLSICNNTSPGFIMNFLVLHALEQKQLLLPTLSILFLSPLLVSFFTRKYYLHINTIDSHFELSSQQTQTDFFPALEHALAAASESLLKIGGYIMLFSIFLSISTHTCASLPLINVLLPLLEITNGIQSISTLALPWKQRYVYSVALTAFGGLCSVAQTNSMIQHSGLSIRNYIKEKLAVAITASLLSFVFIHLFLH